VKKKKEMKVFIVFQLLEEGTCLMEVFDSAKKANAYVKGKVEEDGSNETYEDYQIIKRDLL
jgi:hypothetical protein